MCFFLCFGFMCICNIYIYVNKCICRYIEKRERERRDIGDEERFGIGIGYGF